jgi:hypothetical protein
MKKVLVLLALVALIISACMVESDFVQVGFYRKVTAISTNRVYSYYVKNFEDNPEMWKKMEDFAKSQPYTQRGITAVFFFNDRQNTPDVTLIGLEFPESYEPYCVAGYWKWPTGVEDFKEYPFKK